MEEEKIQSETKESGETGTIEETREQLAKMYLMFLDKQKGGALATGANIGVNLNPLQKDAIAYMTTESKTDKKSFFDVIGKNIKKKIIERFTGGTMLEYDKASLDKMKNLIQTNKDNQAKLQELMSQIEEGVDPTAAENTIESQPGTLAPKESLTAATMPETKEEFRSPFEKTAAYVKITSGFGLRVDPVTGEKNHQHNGIDIAVPEGTPIHPIAGGEVISSKHDRLAGNMITIRSEDGREFSYLHMKSLSPYKIGTIVTTADLIGEVGSTGKSTGPHLHLGEKLDGKFVDPLKDEKITNYFADYKNYDTLMKKDREQEENQTA